MFDAVEADPTETIFPRFRTVALEAINLDLALGRLSNGRYVRITSGFDRSGEDCRLDDDRLWGFVSGSDELGWWWDEIGNYNPYGMN
jgi:hypothetical protein